MSKIEVDCIFCGKDSKRIAWEENGFTGKRGTRVGLKDLQEISRKYSWWKVLPLKGVIFLDFFIRY
jgi:hypothetical protein